MLGTNQSGLSFIVLRSYHVAISLAVGFLSRFMRRDRGPANVGIRWLLEFFGRTQSESGKRPPFGPGKRTMLGRGPDHVGFDHARVGRNVGLKHQMSRTVSVASGDTFAMHPGFISLSRLQLGRLHATGSDCHLHRSDEDSGKIDARQRSHAGSDVTQRQGNLVL